MNPAIFQSDFFAKLGDYRPLQQLLDLLPDVAFFVKDRRGRFVLSSRRSTISMSNPGNMAAARFTSSVRTFTPRDMFAA